MLEERSQLPDDLLLRVANGEHIMSVLASAVEVGVDGSVNVRKLLGAGPAPTPAARIEFPVSAMVIRYAGLFGSLTSENASPSASAAQRLCTLGYRRLTLRCQEVK